MSSEDVRIAIVTLLAGLLAAGVLVTQHYVLMPFQLSRVACYVIGSVPCLLTLSVGVHVLTSSVGLALMPWGIWGIGGAATMGVYWWDGHVSNQLATEADRAPVEGEHVHQS